MQPRHALHPGRDRETAEYLTVAHASGFHEKAGRCQLCFWSYDHKMDRRPTGGATKGSFPPCTCSRNRRFALLPFALFVEPSAPVPVGVLNLQTGAAISVSN